MVGVRKFDEDRVLDAVMATFWRLGWRGTSMDALATATSLQKGSLQNAYGNKEALFLLALKRYATEFRRSMSELPTDYTPLGLAKTYLGALLSRAKDPAVPRGCLTTFGCLEVEGMPVGAAKAVAEQIDKAIEQLAMNYQQFKLEGKLRPESDPSSLAIFLVSTARGIAVLNKIGRPHEEIVSVMRIALLAIEIELSDGLSDRS